VKARELMGEINEYLGLLLGLAAALALVFARALCMRLLLPRKLAKEIQAQNNAASRRGYKLIILNDERTPALFVMDLLEKFFDKTRQEAAATTLHIHRHGEGICAVYDSPLQAENKLAEVTAFIARSAQPLRCLWRAD
jgi:ATP-dependent Clp protease adaptor protein ClpS